MPMALRLSHVLHLAALAVAAGCALATAVDAVMDALAHDMYSQTDFSKQYADPDRECAPLHGTATHPAQ